MSNEIEYRVHLADIGWTDWVQGGEIAGTTGENRRLEAIEFLCGKVLEVQGHVQDIGWQEKRQRKLCRNWNSWRIKTFGSV